jgi:tripartite ATP-independent transporter DctM subunit
MSAVSSLATITMGLIALPSMLKRGYDKDMCIGCIAAGGTLGILIPPSVIMVVYAAFTGESVGALFIGGIIPGILLTSIFMAYIAIRAQLQPNLAPALEVGFSWKEKLVALRGLIPPFLLIILVLGIIYTGAATPTEAAGVGAFGAFLVLILAKRLNWIVLRDSVARTFSITVMCFWIVLGAKSFTHIYVAIGAVKLAEGYVFSMGLNPWVIVITMQIILLFLGMFIDPLGIMLITIPVFVPLITSLGFDPLWFGILFTINMEAAFITPPFGFNLFYMKSIVEPMGFSMRDVYRSIVPFVFLMIIALALVMVFPQLALWLPRTIMK